MEYSYFSKRAAHAYHTACINYEEIVESFRMRLQIINLNHLPALLQRYPRKLFVMTFYSSLALMKIN